MRQEDRNVVILGMLERTRTRRRRMSESLLNIMIEENFEC